MFDEELPRLPPLARTGHASHCTRCLSGLPGSQVDIDSSRLALVFYCLGSLDLLGLLEDKTNETDRESWREWIWEQHTRGRYGAGFKPSSYMTPQGHPEEYSDYDTPHLIMTYTAFLSLSILRDDFLRLDRPGVIKFLQACQGEDGSFSTVPGANDSDLRTSYCAFAISSMLDDWSGVNIDLAIAFIARCRTYEGGYGQAPFCEAQGGTTYTALASLYLVPSTTLSTERLTPSERRQTIRWLVHNQDATGGFRGRTEKEADACYCFWCGASLRILEAEELVEADTLASFIASCQFKYGGIAKAPGEHPDPYHTYLSLAALSMYPRRLDMNSASWNFDSLDPLLNARRETAAWARQYVPGKK